MKGVIIGRNWIKGTVEGHSLYFFFFAISGESTIISKLKVKVEEEGEGRMYGESNMEIYITICKIDSQWKFTV